MLYCGEVLGNGQGPQIDIAVDPLDGTTLISQVQTLTSRAGCDTLVQSSSQHRGAR